MKARDCTRNRVAVEGEAPHLRMCMHIDVHIDMCMHMHMPMAVGNMCMHMAAGNVCMCMCM